jgi:hypothetical protein
MLKKLWRRFRESRAQHEHLKDEVATERFLLDRELRDRERTHDDPLPPGRSNTDWTYFPP